MVYPGEYSMHTWGKYVFLLLPAQNPVDSISSSWFLVFWRFSIIDLLFVLAITDSGVLKYRTIESVNSLGRKARGPEVAGGNKTASGWYIYFFFSLPILCCHPIPKKGNTKECSNYHTVALMSHASRVMLKILQARIQQYMNRELPDVQAGFKKGKGTKDQIANVCWLIEKKKRIPEKYLPLLYWLHQNIWLCGSQQTVENSSRDGNTRPPYLPPEKSVCRSGSNS